MLAPFAWLVWAVGKFLYVLRYRVRRVGLAEAKAGPGPFLILPNHPAYADPIAVFTALWPTFRMRPLVLETNFANPVFALLGAVIRAIKVPDTEKASAEVRDRARASLDVVVAALKAGDNVVLWPSGHLTRTGDDRVGAARAAAEILAAVPEATAVLVRTRGLWGSSFSWARGTRPRLVGGLVRGAKILLANLVFFAPRRKVTMTVAAFPAAARPPATREALNPWLDAWYNADGCEVPTFVPDHFLFGPRTFTFPPPPTAHVLDYSRIKPETKAGVALILKEKLGRELSPAELAPEAALADLGMDSLEGMDVTLKVEQQFGFTGESVPTAVGHLYLLAEGVMDRGPPKPPPAAWFAPPADTGPLEILGETIPAAFLARATRNPKDIVAADDLSGAMTYERMLVGSLVLAARFRDLPGTNVGLLLPASVGCDVAFFALQLAGKTPILLNWTTGPGNVAHAATLTKLAHVVTSKAFIDRTQIEVAGTAFVFLEDLRGGVGKVELLRRLIAVRYFPNWLTRSTLATLANDPHAAAVVLFTSGSEKAPKAVPLTHANIIADLRGAVPIAKVTRADSVLGFLPMFHSFGLSIAGLFPLLAGAKVVHHPDPTDANGLARKAATYQPTLILGTPTFVNVILDRVKPGDLDCVREFIVGAEKCPEAVFEKARRLAPFAEVLEGYGVTECSPCVSLNPSGRSRPGTIGVPLQGVSVCVVALDGGAVLPAGEMGMIHVAGPTVFPGYLGHDGPQPFVQIAGKTWYATGDLGVLDADGFITFHGRLKRFLKIGGEMVSLPALEEPFAALYPPTDAGPRAAVEGVEIPGGRRVVLFTTEDVTLAEANAVLQKNGFRGVLRLDEVRKIAAVPTLGTGKTDYKRLRALLG